MLDYKVAVISDFVGKALAGLSGIIGLAGIVPKFRPK